MNGQPARGGGLSIQQRHDLAQQHRILASIADNDGDRDYHLSRAEVFEKGFVLEYDEELDTYDTELSYDDCLFVKDVLEMFTTISGSLEALTPEERDSLGDQARSLTFSGFDANDRIEGRMLRYCQYLVSKKPPYFREYTDFFTTGERGNSHWSRLPSYRSMVNAFKTLPSHRNGQLLSVDELATVARAEQPEA